MTIPQWLKDRLGTPARGRGCRAVKCIKCQASVLAGFDEDAMAQAVVVDPTPLSTMGEALALVQQRRTYRLGRYDEGLALWHRDHWQISAHPASEECIVLTDHVCGAGPLPGVEIKPLAKSDRKSPYSQDPPF